jgi:hypothetical protein
MSSNICSSPDQSGEGGPVARLSPCSEISTRSDVRRGPSIAESDISRNPDFGRLFQSFSQAGVDSRAALI